MSNNPSKPFSSGTEYEVFQYNYCKKCKKYKVREDGFPALVESGGCKILDNIEYARFDISRFPSDMIRTLRSAKDDTVIAWHYCIGFSPLNNDFESYFEKMKIAIVKEV